MTRLGIGLVIGLTALVGAGVGAAEEVYDNPRAGDAPCIVVKDYTVANQRPQATVQNICQRSVEVRFCFQYLDADGGAGQDCFAAPVRPGAMALVQGEAKPVRYTGPLYEWRFF